MSWAERTSPLVNVAWARSASSQRRQTERLREQTCRSLSSGRRRSMIKVSTSWPVAAGSALGLAVAHVVEAGPCSDDRPRVADAGRHQRIASSGRTSKTNLQETPPESAAAHQHRSFCRLDPPTAYEASAPPSGPLIRCRRASLPVTVRRRPEFLASIGALAYPAAQGVADTAIASAMSNAPLATDILRDLRDQPGVFSAGAVCVARTSRRPRQPSLTLADLPTRRTAASISL